MRFIPFLTSKRLTSELRQAQSQLQQLVQEGSKVQVCIDCCFSAPLHKDESLSKYITRLQEESARYDDLTEELSSHFVNEEGLD